MLDYLFVYEHKVRELESVCLLIAALELKGYSCDVVEIHDLSFKNLKYRFHNKPRVIVVFALYNDIVFNELVVDIVGYCKKVVNLQWEQIISDNEIKLTFYNPKGLAALATHVCWGQNTFHRLHQNGVRNAIITGPLHLDFLRKEFKDFYLTREELCKKYDIDTTKKILLYISSFNFASMKEKEKLAIEKLTGGSYDDMVSLSIMSREKTLTIFEQLLESDYGNEICIIYRPHPWENIDNILIDMSKKHLNFKVIDDCSIKQWILSVDHIFTWYSTSIAEIYFANKSCFLFRPCPIDEEIDVTILKGAKSIATLDEVCSAIRQNDDVEFPISSEVINEYFDFSVDNPSYNRILSLLINIYQNKEYDVVYNNKKSFYLLQFLKKIIKMFIVKYKINSKTWPLSAICNTSKYLDDFWFNYAKVKTEVVSMEEISLLVAKLKKIIQNNI